MKQIYFISFVLSILVFSACCTNWFTQSTKNTEKCKCKEFENYIKSWKVDKETGILYIDRKQEDKESYFEIEKLFLDRLDCLKGKKIAYARKLFQGQLDKTRIIVPKSRECLNCYINRGDCNQMINGKVYCYHLEIFLGDKYDDEIITTTSESLDAVTRQHYVWLYIK